MDKQDAKALLAETICCLINQFITKEKFSDYLKKPARVTLFLRIQKPENSLNYRYISSLPHSEKLFKSICFAHNRLFRKGTFTVCQSV